MNFLFVWLVIFIAENILEVAISVRFNEGLNDDVPLEETPC